ncbi:prostatic spermine-binding protein-like [Tenrec ecaudatus]|uniref:prostatic spermine-binding protein-like n=1 Tax=Tenrec ecaudatus TaxID=94439 RepID=UPI003F59FE3A
MLLALALTFLLGSPTCHAQELQGPGGGSYFYIQGEEQGDIQGIRVFVGFLGLIKGIQLRFGTHWSARYGAPGGRAQELLLWPGERVTGVFGSGRFCVRHLSWSTSAGRQMSVGRPAGPPFCARPRAPGQQLLAAYGLHRPLCLTAIGFRWGFASTPTPIPTAWPTPTGTGQPTTAGAGAGSG